MLNCFKISITKLNSLNSDSKNHQNCGNNLTKSIRNSFPKISILAFLFSFQLESSGNLDACTKQTLIGHYPKENRTNLLLFYFG